ncbi:hypothetical protein MHU86_1668 [Fragilaria crotonensis]|nr:hypothetical protein MHU86_1668 [Fragilaria crotonensis]
MNIGSLPSFAAIISHSCQPSVVQVQAGDLMIVRACAAVKEGEEIVWSYIPPTQSFLAREALLFRKFDFTCQCRRCLVESKLGSLNEQLDAHLGEVDQPNMRWSRKNIEPLVKFLEQALKPLSNEVRHFLRTSYLNLYLTYINASLLQEKIYEKDMSNLVLQLHLTLSVSHNACSEQLSILHLRYDMAANKTFRIEQLKRAHMTRYGPIGQDLQQVRRSMHHTKRIVQSLEGMQRLRMRIKAHTVSVQPVLVKEYHGLRMERSRAEPSVLNSGVFIRGVAACHTRLHSKCQITK